MINALIIMTGLMAGIYFAFSVFIMKSLAGLPATEGAHAMNAINDVIVRSGFLPLFFLSTLAHMGFAVWTLWYGEGLQAQLSIAAGVVYEAGMFLVTVFGNVPLNNRLQQSENNESRLLDVWCEYPTTWTHVNHLRTVVTSLLLTLLVYANSTP